MGVLDRLLNQEKFTEAFDELQKNNKKIAQELETQKAVNKQLAADFIKLEEKVKLLEIDPEQHIEAEIEKRTLDIEAEYAEKMSHKWYGIGRQDAYAEMGIKNIEAHERGNVLIRLPDGEIVEMILGLEDVDPEDTVFIKDIGAMNIPPDEIPIDDLVDTTA